MNMNSNNAEIEISTHTPHARRDPKLYKVGDSMAKISTHTPHARRDFGRYGLPPEII